MFGILQRHIFFQQNSFRYISYQKGDNSYQPRDDSGTQTKSAEVKIRMSKVEACLAKMTSCLFIVHLEIMLLACGHCYGPKRRTAKNVGLVDAKLTLSTE